HPLLTRPFLVANIAKAILAYDLTPADVIAGQQDPLQSVRTIVEAFVKREVEQKWKTRDGRPYLSIEQHMQLLGMLAEEMWKLQRDRLRLDVVEEIASLLLDQWGIVDKRQVIDMVKMHALLTCPSDGNMAYRTFDHPEFQNYF